MTLMRLKNMSAMPIKFVKNPLCPEDRVYVVAKDVLERMCGEGGDKGC